MSSHKISEFKRAEPGRPGRWLQHVIITVLGAVGMSFVMFPAASTWFYQLSQSQVVGAYVDSAASLAPEVRTDLITQAEQYNSALPPGPLSDPYAVIPGGDTQVAEAATARYNGLLAADESGVMARVRIPEIDVDLPVYHGVDDNALARGVGHLPASSLPIGGPGTHSVLVGHTGLANAPLLSDLNKLVVGDTFMVDVYGETLYYQVDQILTVLPSDVSALQIESGKDYVTLVTCTPKWSNTHRLLVRGTRIAAPQEDTMTSLSALAPQPGPGFPWWALIIVAGTVAASLVSVFMLRPQQELLVAARRALVEFGDAELHGLTDDPAEPYWAGWPTLLTVHAD